MINNEETAMRFIDHMDETKPNWSEDASELIEALIKYGNTLNKVASSQPIISTEQSEVAVCPQCKSKEVDQLPFCNMCIRKMLLPEQTG